MTVRQLMVQMKQERIRQGMTQGQMAAIIGRTQSQIARWERHENVPRIDTFVAMADALNMNVQWAPMESRQLSLEG